MGIKILLDREEIAAYLESADSPFPSASLRHLMVPYYSSIFGPPLANESFVVLFENKPVCCAYRMNHSGRLSYFNQPFRIEFARGFFEHDDFENLLRAVSKELWNSQQEISGLDVEIPVAEERTNFLLESVLPRASAHTNYVEVYADLSQNSQELQQAFRKSHRQSISRGRREIEKVETFYGTINDEVFNAFRALHVESAGRATRPESSWELQKQAIIDQQASLIILSYDSRIIGAVFSWLSRSSGLYGSGAFDRSMFATLPISHLGIFRALEHAKQAGVGRFIFGSAYAPGGTQKEKRLATFRKGFSSTRQHFHILRTSV